MHGQVLGVAVNLDLQVWRRMELGCGQVSYLPSAFVVAHLGAGAKSSRQFKPLSSLVWCYCVKGIWQDAIKCGTVG